MIFLEITQVKSECGDTCRSVTRICRCGGQGKERLVLSGQLSQGYRILPHEEFS